MTSEQRPTLPRGVPPWEIFSGLRVGGFTGAVLGGIATAVAGLASAWVILAGAVVGATVGFAIGRRRMRLQPPNQDES